MCVFITWVNSSGDGGGGCGGGCGGDDGVGDGDDGAIAGIRGRGVPLNARDGRAWGRCRGTGRLEEVVVVVASARYDVVEKSKILNVYAAITSARMPFVRRNSVEVVDAVRRGRIVKSKRDDVRGSSHVVVANVVVEHDVHRDDGSCRGDRKLGDVGGRRGRIGSAGGVVTVEKEWLCVGEGNGGRV